MRQKMNTDIATLPRIEASARNATRVVRGAKIDPNANTANEVTMIMRMDAPYTAGRVEIAAASPILAR